MRYNKMLLTGGSGSLGQAIIKSGCFPEILAPPREILDITKPDGIDKFFARNDFDAVMHCAALARMAECENDPVWAIETNIMGTCNLVREVIKVKNRTQKDIRFVYISTDGVYPGIRGNYSEEDETIPYNKYGWTKLGGECAVNLLSDYCIIRTSFFEPDNIKFEDSAIDSYSSKMSIKDLVVAISKILYSGFVGTINIGSERKSDYERYKGFKPALRPCKLNDILQKVPFKMAKDSSMNLDLWKELQNK
jgi:dTDP-4-dehydrorhamnose reductase